METHEMIILDLDALAIIELILVTCTNKTHKHASLVEYVGVYVSGRKKNGLSNGLNFTDYPIF
jgi:hypothetical protein